MRFKPFAAVLPDHVRRSVQADSRLAGYRDSIEVNKLANAFGVSFSDSSASTVATLRHGRSRHKTHKIKCGRLRRRDPHETCLCLKFYNGIFSILRFIELIFTLPPGCSGRPVRDDLENHGC